MSKIMSHIVFLIFIKAQYYQEEVTISAKQNES